MKAQPSAMRLNMRPRSASILSCCCTSIGDRLKPGGRDGGVIRACKGVRIVRSALGYPVGSVRSLTAGRLLTFSEARCIQPDLPVPFHGRLCDLTRVGVAAVLESGGGWLN